MFNKNLIPIILISALFFSLGSAEIITGTVSDSVTGLPLKAVAVTVKGDSTPVYSDSSGYFSLSVQTPITEPAPEMIDLTAASPVRMYNTKGLVVVTGPMMNNTLLPTGVYLVEMEYEGKSYLTSSVITGRRVRLGSRVSGICRKAAGNTTLVFGRSGYLEKELVTSQEITGLSVLMHPRSATVRPVTPSEVGPTDPTILIPSGTIAVTESNTVIENVDVTGYIHIKELVDNVTIRNFRITHGGYWGIFIRQAGSTNITIENGEINGLDSLGNGVSGKNYTARNLFIHNCNDAFKAPGNNHIQNCYIDRLGIGGHGDGVQMRESGDISIVYNTFDLAFGNLTACVFTGSGEYKENILVQGNYLNGGSFTIYCTTGAVTVRDNLFGRDFVYGPRTGTCVVWENNVWVDTGEPILCDVCP